MNDFNNVEIVNEEPITAMMTINDRIVALKQKAAQEVALWDAASGTTIAGILFSKRQVQTQYGNQEQFILKDEHGALIAYWLQKYIEQQLRSNGAHYGDLVAITSHGKQQTNTGKEYNAFSVLVDRVNV